MFSGKKIRFAFLIAAGLAVLFNYSGCLSGGSGGTPPPPTSGSPEVTTACCSSGIPAGYYKVNDNWNSTSCGSPSSITMNVCTYQRYDNKPIGAIMSICNGQPLASGWLRTDTNWNPTSCGRPSSITQNVQTVRRNS